MRPHRRTEDREWSILRGVSIEPLLVNHTGFQLMDGYSINQVQDLRITLPRTLIPSRSNP